MSPRRGEENAAHLNRFETDRPYFLWIHVLNTRHPRTRTGESFSSVLEIITAAASQKRFLITMPSNGRCLGLLFRVG